MNFDANDPRLTAYALGELSDNERAEVEAMLESSPEARAAVDEIRRAAELLTVELAGEPGGELTSRQREAVEQAMHKEAHPTGPIVPERNAGMRWWLAPTALAASILIIAVGVLIPSASEVRESVKLSVEPVNTNAYGSGEPDSLTDTLQTYANQQSDETKLLDAETIASLRSLGYVGGTEEEDTVATLWGMDEADLAFSYGVPEPRAGLQSSSRKQELYNDLEGFFIKSTGDKFAMRLNSKQQVLGLHFTGHSSDEVSDPAIRIPWSHDILYPENWREIVEAKNRGLLENGSDEDRAALTAYVEKMKQDSFDIAWDVSALVQEEATSESYDPALHNPFLHATDNPLSTFSIDVDTASYSNVRRMLKAGRMPPAGAARIEEMVNYFSYDYPQPDDEHPFSVNVDLGECPWAPEHRLMRVGLKGYEIPAEERPTCNLVFLIDVSGSMDEYNKLPLVKEALGLLVDKLWDDDRVALVVYASASGLVLDSTLASDRDTILDAVARLDAGGSTNGGEGIQLAYKVAEEHFIEGGVNRVIMATDGDFNVGMTSQSELTGLIQEQAADGVFLSVLGFGMGNFKDDTLERLADRGNGNYAYIDTLKEARKVLVDQVGSTLVTIAKDVKIQIEFNPAEIAAYRLIGYENRLLAARDFNDDAKDAGEIGAGHSVTALYELVPVGLEPPADDWYETTGESEADEQVTQSSTDVDDPAAQPDPEAIAEQDALHNIADDAEVDPLKYQMPGELAAAAMGISAGEVATVKLRYKQPDGDTSSLLEVSVVDGGTLPADTSDDFRFAASVASFGMLLRDTPHKGDWTFDSVLALALGSIDENADNYRVEFVELVERARELAGE